MEIDRGRQRERERERERVSYTHTQRPQLSGPLKFYQNNKQTSCAPGNKRHPIPAKKPVIRLPWWCTVARNSGSPPAPSALIFSTSNFGELRNCCLGQDHTETFLSLGLSIPRAANSTDGQQKEELIADTSKVLIELVALCQLLIC